MVRGRPDTGTLQDRLAAQVLVAPAGRCRFTPTPVTHTSRPLGHQERARPRATSGCSFWAQAVVRPRAAARLCFRAMQAPDDGARSCESDRGPTVDAGSRGLEPAPVRGVETVWALDREGGAM